MKKARILDKKLIEALWKIVEPLGWSRQGFESKLMREGPTAVLTACPPLAPLPPKRGSREETLWVKDTSPFHVFTDFVALEPPVEKLTSFITPNQFFFVCNEVGTVRVEPSSYRLKVEGDAVERPLELTYDDILQLPSYTLPAFLECAGNNRSLFEKVIGQTAGELQWGLGGIGMAEWVGVSLPVILEMAGVKSNAAYVNVKGLDKDALEGGVSRPMSIEKAMEPETILAYLMNGELLPPDHGFPVRIIVPGWVGTNSVKWVETITVSSEKIWVHRNTNNYIYIGPEWPAEAYAPAAGAPIDEQNIKSSLALPWPATLSSGPQVIRGFARSPNAKITKVEWSADEGQSWQEAILKNPIMKYAWVQFEFTWEATVGKHRLMTRATDELGQTQPDEISHNQVGFLFNMVHPHPVTVV